MIGLDPVGESTSETRKNHRWIIINTCACVCTYGHTHTHTAFAIFKCQEWYVLQVLWPRKWAFVTSEMPLDFSIREFPSRYLSKR